MNSMKLTRDDISNDIEVALGQLFENQILTRISAPVLTTEGRSPRSLFVHCGPRILNVTVDSITVHYENGVLEWEK